MRVNSMTKGDEVWIQRDGTPIAVGDMTEGHAKNTLRMILRNRKKKELQNLPFRPVGFGLGAFHCPGGSHDDFIFIEDGRWDDGDN